MNSLDAITLKAFLAALMRLDSKLPADLQKQLNDIGEAFPSDVSKLNVIAETYSPLEQEYVEVRLALQKDGDRFRFAEPKSDKSAQLSDEEIIHLADEVLKANDSVNLVKKKAQESSRLGQLLFQLQRQTSFTDPIDERLTQLLQDRDVEDDEEIIPPEELEESEVAWQEYLAGRDPGMSLDELKLQLFGEKA